LARVAGVCPAAKGAVTKEHAVNSAATRNVLADIPRSTFAAIILAPRCSATPAKLLMLAAVVSY
jgi:hypothetical protein